MMSGCSYVLDEVGESIMGLDAAKRLNRSYNNDSYNDEDNNNAVERCCLFYASQS